MPTLLAVFRQPASSTCGAGFFAESATIYDFPRNNPDLYLSDYEHFQMGSSGSMGGGSTITTWDCAPGSWQGFGRQTVAYIYEGPIRPIRSAEPRARSVPKKSSNTGSISSGSNADGK